VIAVVLVLMACNQAMQPAPITPTPTATQPVPTTTPVQTPTTTPTPQIITQDKTYNALNPAGIFIPVQTKALAPRLTTIEGKTIYVCQGEADPVIMPALYKRLVKDYTKTKFIYYVRSDFGPSVPGPGQVATSTNQPDDPDILKKVDGVLRGIGW